MYARLRTMMKGDYFWIVLLVLIKFELHMYNVGQYPYIENDEGTYIARALAFIHTGQLDYYTYWYDHTPLGWLFMSGWYLLTGGTTIFSDFVTSGRVFMGVLASANLALVYILGRKIFPKSKLPSIIACLVIMLSPLVIYYQRRVLLDNIMIFWVLIAFVLAYRNRSRLSDVYLAAIAVSFGVLTKLNAIVFIPVILYQIWRTFVKEARLMAAFQYLATVGMIVGSYLMFALLKGEFLPASQNAASGEFERITLIDTLIFQSSRGTKLAPWNQGSDFYQAALDWFHRDYTFIIISVAAIALATIFVVVKRYRNLFPIVAAFWLMLLFLTRGGVVLGFYFLPLVPFAALMVGWMISAPLLSTSGRRSTLAMQAFVAISIIGIILMPLRSPVKRTFATDETRNQQKAIEWIVENIDKDASIAIDNYAFPMLNQYYGYGNADYFFKIEYDPDVQDRLGYTWQNIDYILLTHEMVKQMSEYTVPVIKEALEHSELIADFTGFSTSYIDLEDYVSTNGDWAQVYKVKDDDDIIMQDAWQSFKKDYFRDYGQIIDPENKDITTAKNQAMAMLMAVRQNDKDSFDGIYSWTRDHLQNRVDDKLFSSVWSKNKQGKYTLSDANNTAIADVDIALALIEANEKWGEFKYLEAAGQIIDDIWTKSVFQSNGDYYLSAFLTEAGAKQYINPGYFSPYHYRQFAKIRPDYNWNGLISSGYDLLDGLQKQSNGLVQNWLTVSPDGTLGSAADLVGRFADIHGFESSELEWRLMLDQTFTSNNTRASTVLKRIASYQAAQYKKRGNLPAAFTLSGKPAVAFEDSGVVAYSSLALSANGFAKEAKNMYSFKVFGAYDVTSGEFGSSPSVRVQAASYLTVQLQSVRDDNGQSSLSVPYALYKISTKKD